MKASIALAISIAVVPAICEEKTPSTGKPVGVAARDPEMLAAMEAARTELPKFLKRRGFPDTLKPGQINGLMIKAYFFDADDPEAGEHLWISEVGFDGSSFSGVLSSEPASVKAVSLGDSVSFPITRLSDWLFVEDGMAEGVFTVQLLRSRMSPEERLQHDSNYPFRFRPLKTGHNKPE